MSTSIPASASTPRSEPDPETTAPSRDGVPFGIAGVLLGVTGVMVTNGEFFADAETGGLFVRNLDPYRHTVVIDGQVDTVEIPASSDVRSPIELESGTYRFYCDVTGHEDMAGTLVVG